MPCRSFGGMEKLTSETNEKSDIDLFIEAISKDQVALRTLKNMAASCGHYPVAEKARAIEKELYPHTQEGEQAETKAKEMADVLAIMSIQVTRPTAYRIYLAALAVKKKGGKVKIDEISDIIHKSDTLIR